MTSAGREALYRAWREFHDSFDDDMPVVVEVICSAYKRHMQVVSRGNLDDAVGVLRALAHGDKASELIAAYIKQQGEIRAVDGSDNPFNPVVKDDEFRAALAAVVVPPRRRPMKEILTDINKGISRQDDIDAVLAMSTDELYELFKGLKGDELSPVVEGSLFYRRVINATDAQKELTNRSLQALERIGRESAINAIRVRKFSVMVDADSPNSEPTPI